MHLCVRDSETLRCTAPYHHNFLFLKRLYGARHHKLPKISPTRPRMMNNRARAHRIPYYGKFPVESDSRFRISLSCTAGKIWQLEHMTVSSANGIAQLWSRAPLATRCACEYAQTEACCHWQYGRLLYNAKIERRSLACISASLLFVTNTVYPTILKTFPMAEQGIATDRSAANGANIIPRRSWKRKRSLHSRMQTVRAGKDRTVSRTVQTTPMDQTSSENGDSEPQPLQTPLASEHQEPGPSHSPASSEPQHPGPSHSPASSEAQHPAPAHPPAIDYDDQQPGPSTQTTVLLDTNDELLLSRGQHSNSSTSGNEVHQLH